MAINPQYSGGAVVAQDPDEQVLRSLADMRQESIRQSRMLYDYSKPVDEYEWNLTGFPGPVTIQPQFGLTVRFHSIVFSLPVGITAAVLQIGRRYIPLLQVGAATTAQTVGTLQDVGIIAEGNDLRQLVFTGTPTSGYYIGLNGFRLERA